MSADAWQVCPNCKKEATEKAKVSREAALSQYGHIPAEQFAEMLSKAQQALDDAESMKDTNLREDYEIGMFNDGEFFIDYVGSCKVCGYSKRFNHREPVP